MIWETGSFYWTMDRIAHLLTRGFVPLELEIAAIQYAPPVGGLN